MLTRAAFMLSWEERSGTLELPALLCTRQTSGCASPAMHAMHAAQFGGKFHDIMSHASFSASELLSSNASEPSHAPAPFSLLHCCSASLCPAPTATGFAAAVFKPVDIATASCFQHCLFSEAMWNSLFQPWTMSEDGAVLAQPPQLFFDHESTLDSCHVLYRFAPDWVVVLARVQHLRRRVVLQARCDRYRVLAFF
jgi:hypothetical protein